MLLTTQLWVIIIIMAIQLTLLLVQIKYSKPELVIPIVILMSIIVVLMIPDIVKWFE